MQILVYIAANCFMEPDDRSNDHNENVANGRRPGFGPLSISNCQMMSGFKINESSTRIQVGFTYTFVNIV